MNTETDNINKEDEIIKKADDGIPDDFFGRHKVFTRFMVLAITTIFVYSFVLPLPFVYAEMASYIMIFALMVITFGLNSLKLIAVLIDKWKR